MASAAAKLRHAERARRYRARLRQGRVVIAICFEAERLVPVLTSGGYLPVETESRADLSRAIEQLLQDAIRGYEASLPA